MQILYHGFKFGKIKSNIRGWTWQEINFGYQHNFISKENVIEFAKRSLVEDMPNFDAVLELAIRNLDESIQNDLYILCKNEKSQAEDKIRSKWLYIFLSSLFERKTEIGNIQEVIDNIYADFDYPEEIADLVSYMPYYGVRGENLEKRLETYLNQGKDYYF